MILFKKITISIASLFLNFVYFWWHDSFFWWLEKWQKIHLDIEKTFAVKINLKYIFSPLYQDYSLVGFAVGIPARILRIIFGILIHILILTLLVFLYLCWAVIPFFIIYKIFKSPL